MEDLYFFEAFSEIIKLLLEAKPYPVKVNDSDLNNWTPLLWVSEHDDEEAIRLLIDAGANPKLKGTQEDNEESQLPLDNPMVEEIYEEYKESKLLGAEQRLAISKDKDIDNDLLDKLLQSIKNPDINDPRNLKIIDRYIKQAVNDQHDNILSIYRDRLSKVTTGEQIDKINAQLMKYIQRIKGSKKYKKKSKSKKKYKSKKKIKKTTKKSKKKKIKTKRKSKKKSR